MNWYYIDGPRRVGPFDEYDWAKLVRTGKIQPETLVWHEGMDDQWLPWSQLPHPEPEPEEAGEELELEKGSPEEVKCETPEAFAARIQDQDFQIDIRDCVSRAWEVYKTHFWFIVGAGLLILAILGLGSQASSIIEAAIAMVFRGVLLGGLFFVYLRLMRGEPAGMGDLFAGFRGNLFKPLAMETLVSFLVPQLCFIPFWMAVKMKGVTLENYQTILLSDPATLSVLLLVFLACSIPAIYFAFCWMFAVPLIVDKGMRFWPAMQLSRQKVLEHPWRIGLAMLVAGLLGFSGLVGLGIGILFTLPLNFLILLALYESIFDPQ